MLSYQHAFHAGNHADLLKHFVLSFVLNSLNKKDKPYTFFDTHSGSGVYDLLDNRSLKTGEAQKGIVSLLKENSSSPDFAFYFDFVNSFYKNNLYPGSPLFELGLMRKTDTLILSELHPKEITVLKETMEKYKTSDSPLVQLHNRDGWEMIKALTPPKTRRGTVLIDPSYEETKDYTDAQKTISFINKKWTNGIIMLWYPLLAHREEIINQMIQNITESAKEVNQNVEIENLTLLVASKDSHKEVSLEELKEDKKNPPRLYGSGMLVINAPWKLKETTQGFIDFVQSRII